MSNTTQRIISALVLIFVLVLFSLMGKIGIQIFLLLTGALLVDEAVGKMLKKKRTDFGYWWSQLSFIGGFIFFNFIDNDRSYYTHFINASIGVNICLLFYLYRGRMESLRMIRFLKRFAFIVGAVFLMPYMSMVYLLQKSDWMQFLVFLLFCCYI